MSYDPSSARVPIVCPRLWLGRLRSLSDAADGGVMVKTADELLAEWNGITPEQALATIERAKAEQPDFRTCHFCNGAHDHLVDRVMRCLACGYFYLYGVPAKAVIARSKGEPVTAENVHDFLTTIAES
jgi:hypothetical protein